MADKRLTGPGNLEIPASKREQEKLINGVKSGKGSVARHHLIAPLDSLIHGATMCLYEFIHSNGYMIKRTEWENNIIAPSLKKFRGWVYLFYEGDTALYVGETGGTLAVRFGTHRRNAVNWWPHWVGVKVLPCPNATVRKMFESLAGIAGGHVCNMAQPPLEGETFDEVICSLVAIGNDGNNPICYLHKDVEAAVDDVSNKLPTRRRTRS